MKKQVLTSLFLALISIGAMAKNQALNAVANGFGQTSTYPLSGNSAFTFETWFNGSSGTTYARLIGFSNFAFEIAGGGGTISIYDGGWRATGATGMGSGWHHVAVTNDLTNFVVYIDGVQVYTKAAAVRDFTGQTMYVGINGKTQALNERFPGKFDEVRVWNRALSAFEISIVKNQQLVGNETGLVVYYNFNDGTGTNKVSNTHHLSLTSSPTFLTTNYTDYIQDFALNYDGTDDKTTIATPISANADFTIEAQFKTADATAGIKRIFAWTSYGCEVAIVNGVLKSYIVSGSWTTIGSATGFNDNEWHHFALTKSGTTLSYYIDGNLIGTRTATLALSGTMHVGASQSTTGNDFWKGSLDEIRIWNVVRTQPQIEANMNIELAGTETGLIQYIDFNTPSSGSLVVNVVSPGSSLTRTGAAGTNNLPQYQITTTKNNITTSVGEILSSDAAVLTVYPNPFTSVLTLNIASVNKIVVMDATGKAVYSAYNPATQIDLSSLNAGIYFMNVYTDEAIQTAKVVKQ